MHILITAFGTLGDIQPSMALAKRLIADGHEVLLCAPPDFTDWAKRENVPFHPVGRNFEEWMREHTKVVSTNLIKGYALLAKGLRADIHHQFNDLEKINFGEYDLVLATGIQMASPSLAEAYGVPYRFICFSPQMLPSSDHPPTSVPFQNLPTFCNQLTWFGHRLGFSLTFNGLINRRRRDFGLGPINDYWKHYIGDNPIVATSPHICPLPKDLNHLKETGFLFFPQKEEELDKDILDFIESSEQPVIYAGFGSMIDPKPEQTTRLLVEASKKANVRLLLSKGWANLGDENLPDHVKVIGPTPHAVLFPKLSGIIHHGGSGTTAISAKSGTPQLVVPYMVDQFHFAKSVFEQGIGPKPIPRARLNLKKLVHTIEVLVHDKELRKQAKLVGNKLDNEDGLSNLLKELCLNKIPQEKELLTH